MKNIFTFRFLIYAAALFLLTQCSSENDSAFFAEGDFSSNLNPSDGQGGSWARFTVSGNFLYTVTPQSLNVFDISSPDRPRLTTRQQIGQSIETIFARDTTLFIGSQDGMLIYSIQRNGNPEFLSEYRHRDAVRCPGTQEVPFDVWDLNDPVVSDGQFAFLTLKAQAQCPDGNFATTVVSANQLIVFDLQDLRRPIPIANYDMESPEGLGLWGNMLYVCDAGLKVYDRSNPAALEQVNFYNIPAYDVIPLAQSLLITADDGFHQYDIRGHDLEYVSSILVKR
ncbi:MAG: LVIVD repeat-containing protein [Bernardetiaceae bacterium]